MERKWLVDYLPSRLVKRTIIAWIPVNFVSSSLETSSRQPPGDGYSTSSSMIRVYAPRIFRLFQYTRKLGQFIFFYIFLLLLFCIWLVSTKKKYGSWQEWNNALSAYLSTQQLTFNCYLDNVTRSPVHWHYVSEDENLQLRANSWTVWIWYLICF